jgi:hypothetical protein
MKEIIWRRERIEKERGGGHEKKLIFGIVIFMFVIKNPKTWRENKAFK